MARKQKVRLVEATCTRRAALDARMSSAERALYAVLMPSVQTSGVLISVCRTWEDVLWVMISDQCEERPSEALARLGGGFWEPSCEAQEGSCADDPFHVSQLHIILDHTDALLDDFACRLRDEAYDRESAESVFSLPVDCPSLHRSHVAHGAQVPDDDTCAYTSK